MAWYWIVLITLGGVALGAFLFFLWITKQITGKWFD